MEYRGIDVSKWQGNIDYTKVKSTGIQFIIARIGYGMYEDQKDIEFEDNYKGATNNNIPIGVYLYSYALNENDAKREANVVLKWLNNRKLNLPVYYDIEDKSQATLSKSTLTKMCETFCETIEKAGYWAGIYANKYWLTTHLDYKYLEKKYTIWVAQYNNKNTYSGKYDMWQYTSKGKVNGINGNVDMNILYKDIFTNTKPNNNQNTNTNTLPNLSNYSGASIVDALKQVGYDSSFKSREKLYKLAGFNDIYKGTATQNTNLLNKLRGKTTTNYYPKPNYTGLSLVDALKKINVNSSFENRNIIAIRNGITNYKGTMSQNMKLLKLLKEGKLKK